MPIIQERDRIEIQKRLEAMEKPVKPEAYFLERILLTLEEGKTTAIPGLAESSPSIPPKGLLRVGFLEARQGSRL